MNKRKIRDTLLCVISLIFSPLYIPHIVCFYMSGMSKIEDDVLVMKSKINIELPFI